MQPTTLQEHLHAVWSHVIGHNVPPLHKLQLVCFGLRGATQVGVQTITRRRRVRDLQRSVRLPAEEKSGHDVRPRLPRRLHQAGDNTSPVERQDAVPDMQAAHLDTGGRSDTVPEVYLQVRDHRRFEPEEVLPDSVFIVQRRVHEAEAPDRIPV